MEGRSANDKGQETTQKLREMDRMPSVTVIEPRRGLASPFRIAAALVASLWWHRELVLAMTMREMRGLTAGALLGVGWLVLRPLVRTSLYACVVVLFLGVGNSDWRDYLVYVLSGMVAWQLITLSIEDAPLQILNRQDLLRQTIYPIETLPASSLITATSGAMVTLLVFLVVATIAGALRWHLIFLPIPLLLVMISALGLSWILSVAAVLFKDLREIVTLLTGVLIFASPVFIRQEMVSEKIWKLVLLNPLSHIVFAFRDVVYGEFHALSWFILCIGAALSFLLGAIVIDVVRVKIREYV